MDQIIIRDLLTRGRIGISDAERERPQDILVNIWLFVNTVKTGDTDRLEYSVSYSQVAKEVYSLVERNTRQTVEALAADIAKKCLDHQLVQKVRVRVEKTSAVRFAAAVGVEIERTK